MKTRQKKSEQTSKVIRALEICWYSLRSRYPNIRPAVFVLDYKKGQYGHIWFNSWDRKNNAGLLDEIHINSTRLHQGPEEVMETMIHEAAHSINHELKIQDTSRGYRYHNEKFRTQAENLGLVCNQMRNYGWTDTSLGDAAKKTYAKEIAIMRNAITIYQNLTPAGDPTNGNNPDDSADPDPGTDDDQPDEKKNRQLKATCGCPRIIRMSKKVYEEGVIICENCNQEFKIDV